MAPLRVGVVGCARIAQHYAAGFQRHPDEIELVGGFDLIPEVTQAFANRFGGVAFDSLDDLLARDDIDAVVNLTIHKAHYDVTRQSLLAGKHVQSEKPLATTRQEAAELVQLARGRGLLLGCAPFVIMGQAQQTLWKAIRDGMIGEPIEASAYMIHGRIEKRNPSADKFLGEGAGPLLDVGCYALNVLTGIFGPIATVRGAAADTVIPERVFDVGPKAGQTFEVGTPDHVAGLLKFCSGLPVRVAASFSVWASRLPAIEVYGTDGSLSLDSAFAFNTPVWFRGGEVEEWTALEPVEEPFPGVDWARGVMDMYEAIRDGRELYCPGEQAEHILDVSLSILEAAEQGKAQAVESRFEQRGPLW